MNLNWFPTSTHKYTLLMSSSTDNYYTLENLSSSIRRYCSIFCPFVSIVGLVSLILIFFTFILILFDIDTSYNLPTFRVDSEGSLNSLIVSNTQLTAEFNISVSTDNPTGFTRVYYDDVSAEIFYKGEGLVLTKSSLPLFTTHNKSTSVIQMMLYVNKPSDFGGAASSIAQSLKDGMVEFGLIVSGLFKYKNNICDSGWQSLKVVCNPLKFAVSPNDKIINATNPGILFQGLTCTSELY